MLLTLKSHRISVYNHGVGLIRTLDEGIVATPKFARASIASAYVRNRNSVVCRSGIRRAEQATPGTPALVRMFGTVLCIDHCTLTIRQYGDPARKLGCHIGPLRTTSHIRIAWLERVKIPNESRHDCN